MKKINFEKSEGKDQCYKLRKFDRENGKTLHFQMNG